MMTISCHSWLTLSTLTCLEIVHFDTYPQYRFKTDDWPTIDNFLKENALHTDLVIITLGFWYKGVKWNVTEVSQILKCLPKLTSTKCHISPSNGP